MSQLRFSEVVDQDGAKLALVLAALEPRLAGVLLRGHKGSAKTTLARGLAALLPGNAPFVELPLGATEDRAIGSVDIAVLLARSPGEHHRQGLPVRLGLLAAAHGGVLYVDEINLLADHLVDVLLDVAVSGTNRIEREGVSHDHPARFVLIGSMNPEEGDLRPQLLDRFGLAVDVEAPSDVDARVEVIRRQLAAESPTRAHADDAGDRALAARLGSARCARVPQEVMVLAARVALAAGAEGMRADLMLCRAAGAHAGWCGRSDATAEDVRVVAPFVLAHRRRRNPFDDTGVSGDELDALFAEASAQPEPSGSNDEADSIDDPEPGSHPPNLRASRRGETGAADGRRSQAYGANGRYVRERALTSVDDPIAVVPTAMAVAARRAARPSADVEQADLKGAVRERKIGNLIVIAVDASGSMGAARRIGAAKSAVLGLLTDAYQRRDRVALISFRGDKGDVVLRPTGSVELARTRLAELPTGGMTPLAAGLDAAHAIAEGQSGDTGLVPLIVVITDGRATAGGDDPVAAALASAVSIRRAGIQSVVIDAETGVRTGLAQDLAAALGADHLALDIVAGGAGASIESTVRARLRSR